jgi:excisionase family DNA binding protein
MEIPGYLPSDEAAALLGISRQSLYNLTSHDDFPKPKKIGRTSLWPEEDLKQWRARHPKRQSTNTTEQ